MDTIRIENYQEGQEVEIHRLIILMKAISISMIG